MLVDIPRIDIRPDHWKVVRHILRKHVPQYEVWAFGSRAKWTAKDYSDLDLCIKTDKPLDFKTLALLQEDFSESDLPWKVDIVDWSLISSSFRKVIEPDKIVVQEAGVVGNWRETTLGDICWQQGGSIQTGPFGSQLHASDYTATGTPVVMPVNLIEGHISEQDIARISGEMVEKLARHKLKPNDIVFSRRGDVTRFALVSEREAGWLCGTGCLKVSVGKPVLAIPEFIAATLASPDSKEWLVRYAVGATMPNLNTEILSGIPVTLPPLEEQHAIAETLGALDDRIDNLRQTNATLQAIAAALFKSLFVDFDGVPPENMQESELGLIPRGWRVGSFDEAIEILGGGTPKTSVADYWNGEIPWFSVVDAPVSGQVFVLDTEKKITALGLQNCSAKLLPEMTTIISARGTVGKVAMTGVTMAMNQSCYALRPKQQGGEAFVYFATLRFVEHLQRIAHGAVFDTITRDSFKQVPACLPPDEVIAEFAAIANPLLERIRANGQQAATLATLRDALLPRLISGKLRVGEEARIAEEAD